MYHSIDPPIDRGLPTQTCRPGFEKSPPMKRLAQRARTVPVPVLSSRWRYWQGYGHSLDELPRDIANTAAAVPNARPAQ